MSLLTQASLVITPNGYKEGKLYSVIPSDGSGDLSVTRATTATRVNSQGLVELVPYNLLLNTNTFSSWNLEGGTLTSGFTAPDGSSTAYKYVPSSGGLWAELNLPVMSAGTGATQSIWVKSVSGSNVTFKLGSGYSNQGILNGTATSQWQLFTNSFAFSDGGSMYINAISDPTNGIYVWHPQVVEGNSALDYFPTTNRLNIPRLDYSNGTCPSILVEPQRTNICRDSNNLSGGSWLNQSTNTTLTRIQSGGVDGNAFDRLVVGGAVGSDQGRFVQFTTNVGANAIYSVYLKGSGQAFIGLYNGVSATPTVVTLTSEWTRYQVVSTGGSGTYIDWALFLIGGSTIDVAFHQVEFASYATSYIPTTSASVTRNADVISKTGISSLIGQTEGTLFVDFYNYANNSTIQGTPLAISNGGFYGNAVYFEQYLGSWYCAIWNGTSQQFLGNAGVLSEGWHKLAVAYKANDIAYYVDGNQIAVDTSATIPTCDRVDIGAIGTSTNPEQLGVKAAALWKTRLSNTQLAQLTTI